MPPFQVHCRKLKRRCVIAADGAQAQCEHCILRQKDCQFLRVGEEVTLNAEMGTPVAQSTSVSALQVVSAGTSYPPSMASTLPAGMVTTMTPSLWSGTHPSMAAVAANIQPLNFGALDTHFVQPRAPASPRRAPMPTMSRAQEDMAVTYPASDASGESMAHGLRRRVTDPVWPLTRSQVDPESFFPARLQGTPMLASGQPVGVGYPAREMENVIPQDGFNAVKGEMSPSYSVSRNGTVEQPLPSPPGDYTTWGDVYRLIAKAFIKFIEPQKRAKHPYKSLKRLKGDPQSTKPDWWPSDVPHKEPDHLLKDQRLRLLIHILRKLGGRGITCGELQEVAGDYRRQLLPKEEIGMKMKILNNIFKVRRLEEQYEREEIVLPGRHRGGDASVDNATNIPHFISKHRIEQHLFERTRDAEMSWTVLRPVFFFDNITPDFMGRLVVTAWDAYLQGKPLHCIAVSDIGYFAAQAFLNPAEYRNRCLSLAGDVLTYEHMQEVMRRKMGREAPTTFRVVCYMVMWMAKDMRLMFEWFYAHGYRADIPRLREMYPGLKDFEKWLEEDSQFVKH
ncbi:uncharacterized protein CDV56_107719 [Aspergillus thermomutatus]|uniref:Uncharacterized protein n=1 Tax=Aspergillus thermomutatus TaxID=41047 RepID=A0A397GTA3_ASPTH|nr:uncharacterized protein CDV56_107719 [Aspergillus thermomutatus]RHZ54251.1 hypothetical protein CDV56_107719 [Aspergillus thermomutatus]